MLPCTSFQRFSVAISRTCTRDQLRRVLVGCIGSIVVSAPVQPTSAQCVDYSDYIHAAGYVEVSGTPDRVVVAGSYAYVASGYAGLQIVDISTPGSPQLVGGFDWNHFAGGVDVSGSYAYVAVGLDGLQVVDISNPSAPHVVGGVGSDPSDIYSPSDIAVSDDLAIVAYGQDSLEVVDVSNPAAPYVVGTVDMPDQAEGVSVAGDYLFVADGDSGLQVIDISTPASPEIVADLPAADANDVTVSGDSAYVATDDGLQIVDVTDPTTPQLLTTLETDTSALYSVTVSGDRAFVVGVSVLQSIDLSVPEVVGQVRLAGSSGDVATSGSQAVVTGQDVVQTFDISNPMSPPVLGHLEGSLYVWDDLVAASGDYAYLIRNEITPTLKVVDVSAPDSPSTVSSMDLPYVPRDMTVAGTAVFLADPIGLKIVGVSDPASPEIVGSVETPDEGRAVAVAGTLACVTDDAPGLRVISISDPTSPEIVGGVTMPDRPLGVAVSGDYAYVAADDDGGLQIVDISDPTMPEIVGSVLTTDNAADVDLVGDHAFVALDDVGMDVVDVSTPTSPQIVRTVETPDRAVGVSAVGNYAYVSDFFSGLQVIDISTPSAARIIGTVDTPNIAQDVAVSGELAFIADDHGGFFVLPAQCDDMVPVLLDRFDVRAVGSGVRVEWTLLRSSSPAAFQVTARRDGSRWDVPVNAAGEFRFSAFDDRVDLGAGGYVTYSLRGREPGSDWTLLAQDTLELTAIGDRMRLIAPAPNPFNPSTRIRFDLPAASTVTLAIYDVNGRRVRVLRDHERLPLGRHEVEWDGRDDEGRSLASGVYVCRLRAGKREDSRRLTLVQ